AEIADADDAEPGQSCHVGLGKIGHRARAEQHAAPDAPAIGRLVTADVAKIMATLQREKGIFGVDQGATFLLLAGLSPAGLLAGAAGSGATGGATLTIVVGGLAATPGESSSALVSIVSSARRAAT